MKKILITMAVLTNMVAGALVFSSFAAPKTNDETVCSQINANDGWRQVGKYQGRAEYRDGSSRDILTFVVWEKDGLCNAYYWVVANSGNYNPDEAARNYVSTGALRKNSEGRWYAACSSLIYYLDDF